MLNMLTTKLTDTVLQVLRLHNYWLLISIIAHRGYVLGILSCLALMPCSFAQVFKCFNYVIVVNIM